MIANVDVRTEALQTLARVSDVSPKALKTLGNGNTAKARDRPCRIGPRERLDWVPRQKKLTARTLLSKAYAIDGNHTE